MDDVNVNILDTITRNAAGEIPFGSFVIRSAAGTVVVAPTGSNTLGYDGIAMQDAIERKPAGVYSLYDPVPVIPSGRVNVWVVGGGTDITSGNFLKLSTIYGLTELDNATTRSISTSVVKAQEDQEISDYTSGGMTATAGSTTIAVTSNEYIVAGDYLYLESSEGNEVKQVESVSGATAVELIRAATITHATSGYARTLIQCEGVLL